MFKNEKIDSYKEKLNKNVDKLKLSYFNLINEGKETKEIIEIISYSIKHKIPLTPEQKLKVDEQIKDIGKLTLLMPLVILPGSPISIPLFYSLAKKMGIDIIPSSFKNIEDNEIIKEFNEIDKNELHPNLSESDIELIKEFQSIINIEDIKRDI